MHIKFGIESPYEGKAIAWALAYPGCFAYGQDEEEALLRAPQTFIDYQNWLKTKAGSQSWLSDIRDFDIRLTETFRTFSINDEYERVPEGYLVNAWFQSDWVPLNRIEVVQGLKLLDWSREDLLTVASQLSPAQLEKEYPGERWNIRGILKHIGGAEWWYLDRLGLGGFTRDSLPRDPFERLAAVRDRLKTLLPDMAGEEMVRGKEGEFWSPRKVLRRSLWHEKDHLIHIQKLLQIS